MDSRENFKVTIRVRPPLPREIDPAFGFSSIVQVSPDNKRITIVEYLGAEIYENERQRDMMENPSLCTHHSFTFDTVYGEDSTQVQVYETTARPAVHSVLEGYNATILAYGQTGTGKTYTMEGFKYNSQDPQRGIVPRSIEEIFRYIESSHNSNTTFMVRASYLQIYNEFISDLLKSERGFLQIREEKRRGVFVEGLSEWAVRSPTEIYSLMQKGQVSRATASTKMNDISSRSHAVFIIIVEQMSTIQYEDSTEGRQIKVGKLNLVDLAGSERVRVTGATGRCLEEAKKINQSLSALGNVIAALTEMKIRSHIPYRDSKLTRLLEDSLGGNCKTTMMAMISPANEAFLESLSSLKFANRAKKIKNSPHINEDVDQKALLRKYEVELRRLRNELELKNQNVTDMKRVIELEDEKRRAEADKEAAIEALEQRSKEYLLEKEQKKKLEERIKLMNSQLLIGGKKIEDTPQFRTALEERQKAIRQEYEGKLQEIERERQQIEEDKAQIDRYKQLLLRQRDIMIALTARLNERDETIIQLQEELDAYDKIHRETEEQLEAKSYRAEQLEVALRTHGIQVPPEESPQLFHTNKDIKRYPPYSTDSMNLDAESYVPLQMLTAEEKINELLQVVDQRNSEIESLKRGNGFSVAAAHNTSPTAFAVEEVLQFEVLPQLEGILARIADGTYPFTQIENDLGRIVEQLGGNVGVVKPASLSPAKPVRQSLRANPPPPAAAPAEKKSGSRTISLDLNVRGLPTAAATPAQGAASSPQAAASSERKRPLTVDEMIMLKKQEIKKKREMEAAARQTAG